MSPRSFSAAAWGRNADWFEAILDHPFLTELAAGTLAQEVFVRYLVDDMHYLRRYAQTLTLTAARWPDPTGAEQLARFATGAVAGEQVVQQDLMEHFGMSASAAALPEPTLTCLAYAGSLQADAASAPAQVAAAGVLPCFRVYAEIGARLGATAELDQAHPYRSWLAAYAAPRFAADTATAEKVVDDVATPQVRAAMDDAYDRAFRFEWMFWDTAYRPTAWPTPDLRRDAGDPEPLSAR